MNRLFKRAVLGCSVALIAFGFGIRLGRGAETSIGGSYTGDSLPEPPIQRRPWAPPRWKVFPGSEELIETARVLFENGMADPRGGEYRRIKIRIGNVGNTIGTDVETH